MQNPSLHYPLVYLEWHDAYANASWMDDDDFQLWKSDPNAMTIHEIGWLIEQDKEKIIVAHRYNEAQEQFGNFQMIPRTWVKLTVLAKPKKRKLVA